MATIEYLLIQTSIGDYRQQVLEELASSLGKSFQVRCGREYFYPSLRTRVVLPGHVEFIRNRFLFGRRILWQSGVVATAIAAHQVILEYNPRIVSNWAILLIRWLRGSRTALWGHAWSRVGQASPTEPIRRMMRKLSSCVIVYTENQRCELAAVDKSRNIIAAPNSLYRRSQMRLVGDNRTRHSFIYVGRLVSEKKPTLLINAFSAAALPDNSHLLIVGDGPETDSCKALVEAKGLTGRVEFLGHQGDPEALAKIYCQALASVSPGCVGLAVTQSLSFGVPMIIADDEPHGPEIEAAIAGENSLFFRADSDLALAEALEVIYLKRDDWIGRAQQIVQGCKQRYSVEHMGSQLIAGFRA